MFLTLRYVVKQPSIRQTWQTRRHGAGLSAVHVSRIGCYSTYGQSVKTTRVSKHLLLNELEANSVTSNSNTKKTEKPLVLLFDWLYAKPNQLRKYSALYHDIGLDVLTVTGRLSNFLWPPVGYKLAEEIFNYLFVERKTKDELLIHAFSIGAFNYTICLTLADRHPELYGMFRDRVIGQVFDSIVIGSYKNMTEGMVTLLPNVVFKKAVYPVVDMYYRATSKNTKDEYDRLVALFIEKPIQVPTIFFYSENDPMCHVPTMESMLRNWRENIPKFQVEAKSWEVSQHTAHLKHHPEEYLQVWQKLVDKVL
ncbi:transmembrane protein 53-B-like [Haliotis cracherodii]|uniref:transmembrane protein 53-B-like n=1 Tax=Haliotis cracherodii TaxID=6455 RepID=UPI0039ECD76B